MYVTMNEICINRTLAHLKSGEELRWPKKRKSTEEVWETTHVRKVLVILAYRPELIPLKPLYTCL